MEESNSYITIRVRKITVILAVLVTIGLIITLAYFIGKASAEPEFFKPKIQPTIYVQPQPTIKQVEPVPTVIINESDKPSNIPASVDAKYKEVEPIYRRASGPGLGSGIKYCKGPDEIYMVWGSGGYTGESHYYSLNGTYLGKDVFSDVLTDDRNSENINLSISQYNCLDMVVSEGTTTDNIYPPIP